MIHLHPPAASSPAQPVPPMSSTPVTVDDDAHDDTRVIAAFLLGMFCSLVAAIAIGIATTDDGKVAELKADNARLQGELDAMRIHSQILEHRASNADVALTALSMCEVRCPSHR